MSNHSQPATGKQLTYLRALASQTGTTFVTPGDRRQASREIERLRSLKRERGRHIEPASPTGREPVYATAPDKGEIEGWGASARWRTSKSRAARRSTASPGTEDVGAGGADGVPARRLTTYRHDATGTTREVVAMKVSDATLVVDRRVGTEEDARLVGCLEADEPAENAEILTRMYIEDPDRGRCRPLVDEDLRAPTDDPRASQSNGGRWDSPLAVRLGAPTPQYGLMREGRGFASGLLRLTRGRSRHDPVWRLIGELHAKR
jgi:hypothetical protein